MADLLGETLSPSVLVPYGISERKDLRTIFSEFRKEIKLLTGLNSQEFLNRILEIEGLFMEKLSGSELKLLALASETIGVAIKNKNANLGPQNERTKSHEAALESIELQREVVKIALANTDSGSGKYNKNVAYYFAILSEIYRDHFQSQRSQDGELGIHLEAGFLRGIRGMVTTAFLFNALGWEVALPDPDWDYLYDIDLIVRTPHGKVFGVDVTAKRYTATGELMTPFFVSRKSPENGTPDFLRESMDFLRVNVPPLASYASEGFYKNRPLGLPNEIKIREFGTMLAQIK